MQKLFYAVRYALSDKVSQLRLTKHINSSIEERYHACLSEIKNFEMLIVLDNCDGYMEAEATQFQQFILDLTQKIQECSVLITARDYNGTDTDIKFSKLQVPKLNPQGVVSLLSNTKKDEEKVYGELADLYSHTVIQVSNDGKT